MNNLFKEFIQSILPWLKTSGIKIIAIFLGTYFIVKFSGLFIEKLVRKSVRPDHFLSKDAEKKREDTIIRTSEGTVNILLWLTAILMILSELGVNIAPLLGAAGVAGLALGFGGQYLIRDVISGLFIILENQYRVGDVACFDGTCGLVEDITLRMTILRDLDGVVHNVPNGEIKKASNLSKDFARINLNIGISYNADLEKVIEVVNRIGKELAEDSQWKEHITKAPQFLRVNDFADSAVVIKILGETKPLQQWSATGELRKRLKIAFDKEGIEIPFPQRVVRQV